MKIEDIFTVKLVGIVEDEELSFKNIQQKVYLDINEKGLEFSAGNNTENLKYQKVFKKEYLLYSVLQLTHRREN